MKQLIPVDASDRDLAEVNELLRWQAGTPLPDGRILGRVGSHGKKYLVPVPIPDRRISRLDEMIPMADLRVLEVGCLEGIHTVGLSMYAREVVALDVRPENVIKTLTRVSWYGANAQVYQANVEFLDNRFGTFDLTFHCGVLYHLRHPVEHLAAVRRLTRHMYLDTHVAPEDASPYEFDVDGTNYRGMTYTEAGWEDPFSGADPTAVWLTADSLRDALRTAGFRQIKEIERREERNGPRHALLVS